LSHIVSGAGWKEKLKYSLKPIIINAFKQDVFTYNKYSRIMTRKNWKKTLDKLIK